MKEIWRRALRFSLAWIGVLCLVGGCHKADVPYSATLDRNALMHLPFPNWQTADQGKILALDLSGAGSTKDKSKADHALTLSEVSPIYVVRLDATHAALLTQALPVEDGDQPMTCHACSGTIGAYFFEHSERGWRLTDRQDALADSGVEGNIGRTSITKLDEGHFALSAQWGSCWQGFCGAWLVVAGLVPGKATLLAPGIPVSADNGGAYEECEAVDKPHAEATPQSDEASHECFGVSSQWKYQGSHLLIAFNGTVSTLDANGKRLPTQRIAQQQVFALEPGHMTLLEGTNPVPHF